MYNSDMNTLDMLKCALVMFVALILIIFAIVMAAKIDKTIIDNKVDLQEQVDTIQSQIRSNSI